MMRRRRRNTSQELDISPLIDVVFILLIFFMVSTTFVKDMQIDLDRPSASSASRASTKALRVYIDRQEVFYVGEAPVQPWMLQSRIRELSRDSTESSALVVADEGVSAQKLIEAVDACRLAGVADVGVITEQEQG